MAEAEEILHERKNKSLALDTFIRAIESRPLALEEFDDKLWAVAVEKVTVTIKGKLVFNFKDGTETEV